MFLRFSNPSVPEVNPVGREKKNPVPIIAWLSINMCVLKRRSVYTYNATEKRQRGLEENRKRKEK